MKRLLVLLLTFLLLISTAITFAQDEEESDMMMETQPVFEIAIREVVDAEGFATLAPERDALRQDVEGYLGSREYTTFFSLAPEMAEGQTFAVGITAWESEDAYNASATLLENETVSAYLETIETIQSVLVEPFVMGEQISLEDFPAAGEVFEVAIRDLSSYEDPVDFFRAIRGFTDALGQEPGVLREYEWLSTDGQYFVGMTRYESVEAFQAASQAAAVFANPATGYLFATYPPLVAQITTLNDVGDMSE